MRAALLAAAASLLLGQSPPAVSPSGTTTAGTLEAPGTSTLTIKGGGGSTVPVVVRPKTTLVSGPIFSIYLADGTPMYHANPDGSFVGGKFNDYVGATFGGRGKLAGLPANGAADCYGTATLVAGTKVVSTSCITANSLVWVTVNTPGGTVGIPSVPSGSLVAGTSFTINSSSGADTSTVNYFIADKAP